MTSILQGHLSAHPDKRDLALVEAITSEVVASDPTLNAWLDEYGSLHRDRIAQDMDLMRAKFAPSSKLLDVGSMPPLFIGAARRTGYDVVGLDIDPARFSNAIAEHRLDIRRCDVERETIPYDDGVFDGAVFNEIFEHLRLDPIKTLSEVKRVLKPGGLLLLSTPNGLSLRHWISLLSSGKIGPNIYKEFEKLNSLGHMGHVREYTVNEVAEFLGNLGFAVHQVFYRGRYGSTGSTSGARMAAANALCSLAPQLRPFFSLVAEKT